MSTIIEKIEEARQFLVSQACEPQNLDLFLVQVLVNLPKKSKMLLLFHTKKSQTGVNQQ